jgi:predicted ATP-dependent serine protease
MNFKQMLNAFVNGGASSLGDMIRQGPSLPETIAGGLYRGRVHMLVAAPEIGKSTLALWFTQQVLNAGKPVVFLDEEMGHNQVAGRMAALGFDPAAVDRLLYYHAFERRTWQEPDVQWLHKLVAKRKPALVVWDSLAEFLSNAGIAEGSAGEVTGFFRRVVAPLANDYGASVLILDHTVKSAKESDRYARGSSAKLATVDVSLRLEREGSEGFSRNRPATLKLIVHKDRLGALQLAPRWLVSVADGRMTITPQADN